MSLEHLLTKLMSFKTVTGSREEVLKAYDWIKAELQPVPMYIREYDVKDHPTLIITPGRSKRVKLWLVAHVDVVPGRDELFKPKKRGSKLLGRGAYDMKFAIACYIALLKEYGVQVQNYDIGVMLTSDEEWGGHNGVKHMLEREGFTGDVAFLPDGTGSWTFEEQAKGKSIFEIHTTGVATHGSRPWEGSSANHELCSYVTDLVTEFEAFKKGHTKNHWHATISVGTMQGGVSANVVSPYAKAELDIRYTSKEERLAIRKIFSRLKKKYRNTKLIILHDDPPYGIKRKNSYVKKFNRIAKEHCGVSCGWANAHGASDARFFNRVGIPTILISPNGGAAHSDKEWIDIKDLERYQCVLRAFIDEVARR